MPAYDHLVRDYHALVYRIALGIVRDPATAEDVAQDVFLDFLRHPEPLERASNVKAFVGRAAVNRALKAIRGNERREKRELLAERRAAMDPIEVAFRAEVRAKVDELPAEQALAVKLHYYHGFTLDEAAEAMDVPVGTASSRISTAVAKLRKWLSAAAFAALVAKLENELSACEAAPVPAGLESRLLRLPTAVPTGVGSRETGARRSTKAAAAALAVAVLLAIFSGRWIQRNDPRWREGEPTESSALAAKDAVLPAKPAGDASSAGSSATSAPPAEIAAAQRDAEWVLEGFLYRTPKGLCVGVESVPPATAFVPGKRMQFFAVHGAPGWLVDSPLVASLPACDTLDFQPFLAGQCGADGAPRARVRLKVRGQQPVQTVVMMEGTEFEPTDFEVPAPEVMELPAETAKLDDLGAQFAELANKLTITHVERRQAEMSWEEGEAEVLVSRALTSANRKANDFQVDLKTGEAKEAEPIRVEVLEVLEVELLSDAWLAAWREMYTSAGELVSVGFMEPGMRKREALVALAARLAGAVEQARFARAGQEVVAWRVRREAEFAAGPMAELRSYGLDRFLPTMADAESLRKLFLESKSPEDFRERVLAAFGEEGLHIVFETGLEQEILKSGGMVVYNSTSGGPRAAGELAALDPERFAGTQAATREFLERTPAKRGGDASIPGLTLESPTPLERERNGFDRGARVASVQPGSTAARAGLAAGDLVWKATVTHRCEDGTVAAAPERFVESPEHLADLLAGSCGPAKLQVLRGTEIVELEIPKD